MVQNRVPIKPVKGEIHGGGQQLRPEITTKLSIRAKRKPAEWDNAYLLKVLTA